MTKKAEVLTGRACETMFRKIGFLRTRAIRGHMKAAIDNPPTARVKEKITAELAKVPYPERVLCRK